MSEKVIIPDTVTPAEEEVEYDGEILLSTSHDYITSAVNAMAAIDSIDTAILSKTDENRIKKIKRQSLRILSHYINEIYEETFDDSVTNNDE
jgi:hypothetical protein